MRLMILGAGGTGGYFGGRLAQAGVDATFLVRPARAALLRERGLRIRSPLGDADIAVQAVTADELVHAAPFDLVLLSCKAYDLDSAMDAIAPAVAAGARVLPLLNGLRHYEALDARFGFANVPGGLCFISATLGADGEILHLGKPASMTFGEREGQAPDARLQALAAACTQAGIDHMHTPDIAQAQWAKYSFLTALAAGTCQMRAPIGTLVAGEGGVEFMTALHGECLAVAAASGHPIPAAAQASARETLTAAGSPMKASMLRDLEAGQRVEAAHIVGDMVHRAAAHGIATPHLQAAWVHLQAYEAQRPA
ncbi:2-dehydropantoate 2-reductase [Pseudoxanthomonas sp. F37]|uniref:2-dehydropantoate 2-reductase n=1 Tax=Pseudoxanthomonas TaxID=83618 RepID=UPI001FD6014C|nr:MULTISPECIES: 2-dehydropantoate 2-reductase [Pseudoxanthomonas]UOV03870.1 2-dehydropantoate 2-reductase [Pseudoxanthomonas mexicana]UOV08867.1 2-dehydropantoate 2-reductase [Pseudoxanthomonas sp. F37]